MPEGAEAQWISVGGDLVEAGLWFGLLARDGVRRAALVLPADGDELDAAERGDGRGHAGAGRGPVGTVLYEPDAAVIRAGLVGQVAAAVGGRLLDRTIAYVTGDRLVRTPSPPPTPSRTSSRSSSSRCGPGCVTGAWAG